MLVVTHEMGFARRAAHRVVFMADGEIVEDAAPETFFSNPTLRPRQGLPRQDPHPLVAPYRSRRKDRSSMRLSHLHRSPPSRRPLRRSPSTACGEQAELGGSVGPGPGRRRGRHLRAGTTMARLNEAGTLRVGTKFDQPLFGLQGPRRQPRRLRRRDRQDRRRPSSASRPRRSPTPRRPRASVRTSSPTTRSTSSSRRTRSTTPARSASRFAGPYYVAGQDLMVKADNTTITGPGLAARGQRPRLLGDRLDAGARTSSSTSTPANLVLFDVYSEVRRRPAQRPGRRGHHRQRHPAGPDRLQPGCVQAGRRRPFTEEPYGIGITKGDVAFCEFINQTLQDAATDGSYAGRVGRPPSARCAAGGSGRCRRPTPAADARRRRVRGRFGPAGAPSVCPRGVTRGRPDRGVPAVLRRVPRHPAHLPVRRASAL